MLAEVEAQERLVDVDNLVYNPVCVNTFNLNPSKETVIEFPIVTKKPKPSQLSTFKFDTASNIDESGQHSPANLAKTIPIDESRQHINVISTADLSKTAVDNSGRCINTPAANLSKTTIASNIDESGQHTPAGDLTTVDNSGRCINTFNLTPSEEATIELPLPTTAKRKKKSHVNVYDFGEIEDNEGSSATEIESVQDKDINELSPCEIWYEGIYRDESNLPADEQIEMNPSPSTFSDHMYDDIIQDSQEYYVSSSDEKTGDDYESSGSEEDVSNIPPIKPEIKLMVKTQDNGREEVELRTIKDLLELSKSQEKEIDNSFTRNTLPRRRPININLQGCEFKSKPTFTLQRLFVRSENNDPILHIHKNIQNTKHISKSQPELIASSNLKYPLQFDPNEALWFGSKQTNDKADSSLVTYTEISTTDNFPSAYCDWLLPLDRKSEGNVKLVLFSVQFHLIRMVSVLEFCSW